MSGDYIYVNGFGWVFNEGGGGYGEINYDMYCNGQYNRILWITVNAVFTVFYSYVFLLTDATRIVISVSPM